jgi:hypothetical protein
MNSTLQGSTPYSKSKLSLTRETQEMPNPEPVCARTLPLCGKTFGFIFSAVTGRILSRNFFQFSDIEKLAIFFANLQ